MFACMHIPEISLEAIVRGEPDLRGHALAVLEGTPPMLTVIAANEAARRSGIEIRMSREEAGMATAVALRRRSLSQEAAAHAALLDCAHAFSPRVEDAAPDTAILDIDGLEHLFGAPAKIARDLARRASQSGLEVQVATASNPDAAMHAARGFAGITVVPAGKEAERLGALPVEVLFSSASGGPGWKINKDAPPGPGGQFGLARDEDEDKDKREILEILERWGVRTLRTLAALPARAVAERLGQNGVALQKLARGAGDRPLVPATAPMEFSEAMELEHPVELLEPLGFILARMLEQLVSRLKARALATQELRLRLQLAAHSAVHSDAETQPGAGLPVHERSLRLPVPMQDAGIFLRLLQLDLKSHPPAGAVVQVWLAAEPTRPRLAQGGLFLPLVPPPERLELVLARIAGVVGEGNAGSPEIVDTHRPQSFRMRRFSPPAPALSLSRKKTAEKPFSRNPRLALRIFRPPLPARAELRGSRPLRFTFLGLRREVLALSGPWRTSGEWWTDCGWARDEWEVVFSDATYRAYRDLLTGQWWIEGEYD